MNKITKRSAKVSVVFALTTIFAALLLFIALDWTESWASRDRGAYMVTLNGQNIGMAKSMEDVNAAMLSARLQVNKEKGAIVYSDPVVEITNQGGMFADTLSMAELKNNFYIAFMNSLDSQVKAYVVDIDGYTVTLDSKESVVALLNAAKEKFDIENEFEIELVDNGDGYYSALTFGVNHAEKEENTARSKAFSRVYSVNRENEVAAEEEGFKDGLVGLSFVEKVEIIETYVNADKIMKLSDAIADVTKEKAQNEVYIVQNGDCFFDIAVMHDLSLKELFAINPDLTENSIIVPGDQIIVTVPKPELSVVVSEERTYDEYYNAEVQYVENDSMFTTESNQISEGSPGYRRVVAIITYTNGVETGRKIINENVLEEATPAVVEVGTQIPPTYVKPISGGSLSSPFGARWGTVHHGVDWFVGMGTTVYASCGGTVIQSGWNGGYGYCVTLVHPDGRQTKYAHLSSVACSVGDSVNQYDVIGYTGSTGDSTGPHLHFELIIGGVPVDPLEYL